MSNYEDEHLKVVSRAGSDKQGIALWKCMCKHCGNNFITRGSSIRIGDVKSCGCVHSLNEQTLLKYYEKIILSLQLSIPFQTYLD